MGTVERITAAVEVYRSEVGCLPPRVVVSLYEELPRFVSGVALVPSKDLIPGHYVMHRDRNWQPVWDEMLARHKRIVAAGCIPAIKRQRVGIEQRHEGLVDVDID